MSYCRNDLLTCIQYTKTNFTVGLNSELISIVDIVVLFQVLLTVEIELFKNVTSFENLVD